MIVYVRDLDRPERVFGVELDAIEPVWPLVLGQVGSEERAFGGEEAFAEGRKLRRFGCSCRGTGQQGGWYNTALMLRRAPERTVDERRNALEEANRVRFARAATKRDLKSGDLDIYDLLMDPSEELRGAKVEEMLLAMRGMGRIKVNRVLRDAGVSRSKTLVGLTHGQRDRLLGALGCEDV